MTFVEAEKFFRFIRYAIGNESTPLTMSNKEWRKFFDFCQNQAVTGVAFEGISKQKLPEAIGLPKDLLYKWISICEQLKELNKRCNKRCVEITCFFHVRGFESCILKGQGNAQMYPNPYSRNAGDIDIWVGGNRKEIVGIIREKYPAVFENYHHIDFPFFADIPVEVHFTPGTLPRPKYNKRFQSYAKEHFEEEVNNIVCLYGEDEQVSVSTLKFNLIYQMAHMMVHFFDEGVGLRHFVDYYYVLKRSCIQNVDFLDINDTLRYLGLEKFANGVMWVEINYLGFNNKYLIGHPSPKIGSTIFHEMIEGGNFGQHDDRYGLRKYGYLGRGLADTFRLLKLFSIFPSESLWKIIWKIRNQRWKIKSVITYRNWF